MAVVCKCNKERLTSDDEHDEEDDRQPPEGHRHRLDGKVLHVIQLLHHNKMTYVTAISPLHAMLCHTIPFMSLNISIM